MVKKPEARCWLCESLELEADSRGVRCRSCGATWNNVPKPVADIITMRRDYGTGGSSGSPSDSLKKRLAKVKDNAIH